MIDERTAAWGVTVLLACVALFQLALAAGAPWGSLAMGGRFPGRMPPPMRLAALVQILIYLAMAGVLLLRSGAIVVAGAPGMVVAAYVVTGVLALSVAMNLITPSKWERRIWAPVALLMFAGSAWVAFT